MNLKKTEVLHAKFEGDKIKVLHGEDTTPIQWQAHLDREFGNNGFTDGKQFRKIASIPETVMAEHPEFQYDRHALNMWLENEGAAFRCVKGGF